MLHALVFAVNDPVVVYNFAIIVRPNGTRIKPVMQREQRDKVPPELHRVVSVKIPNIVTILNLALDVKCLLLKWTMDHAIIWFAQFVVRNFVGCV